MLFCYPFRAANIVARTYQYDEFQSHYYAIIKATTNLMLKKY
jgi:hypothetical protein